MGHDVSRRPLIAKGGFLYRYILCGVCGGFSPRPVHLESSVDKVALRQVNLRYIDGEETRRAYMKCSSVFSSVNSLRSVAALLMCTIR